VAAPAVEILIVGRVIQALGGCAGLVLARAIIRDVYGPNASASMIGYVTMGMAVGPMVTPAIGGAIAEVASWRLVFVAMGAIGLTALVFTWLWLAETRQRMPSGAVFQRWSLELVALVGLRDFWLFALTLGFLSTSFFAFIAGGVFVATAVFGLSASQYGLFFIMTVAGYVVGNFVVGRFGARVGIVRMIVMGNGVSLCAVLAAAGLALAGVDHPLALFVPMLFVGLGNGFALPNAVAGAVSVRPQLAGTASGLAGAFQVGSGAVASVIVGLLIDFAVWDGTRWPMLVPMLCGAAAAFALSLVLPRRAG
jgi:DHA1 family bicyclomycin/chloramphenicol resistance-like MFS transporter